MRVGVCGYLWGVWEQSWQTKLSEETSKDGEYSSCTDICIYMYMCLQTFTCMHRMHAYTCNTFACVDLTCTHTHTYACKHACMCTCKHTNICKYIREIYYIQIRIRIHTSPYMYTSRCWPGIAGAAPTRVITKQTQKAALRITFASIPGAHPPTNSLMSRCVNFYS